MNLASDATSCPACGAARPAAADGSAREIRPLARPTVSRDGTPGKPGKPSLPQAGEVFAKRYRVEKYLGLGSLCNSYLCRDTEAGNREVVLKVMHARKASEAGLAESFLFLAESVSKYDQKGIAKIHAWGSHEGTPYYVMEWVSGVPLRLWLMERLNFENRVLPGLGIISSLLDIFGAIHERGCYGCLKPENVFVTLNGPVVTDFGVVGFLSPQEFEFNSYARRYLPYMAPEIRQDWSNLLPHSDFFSLGAILYEILVGRAPAAQLRLPSELSTLFGMESDEIILKSMAAKPMDRFITVETFKSAVVSLQSSLLNANPAQESREASQPAFPNVIARDRVSMDISADITVDGYPEEGRPGSESETIFSPGQPGNPVRAFRDAPWVREGTPDSLNGVDGPFHAAESGPAARAIFPPRTDGEESEKTLSAFAQLGDRIVEEAHAQRRFSHAPRIHSEAEAEAPFTGTTAAHAWKAPLTEEAAPENPGRDENEIETEPVPAWLWISIALAGSCMVVLSAYFGLLNPNG